jgi:hypothetical protein
MQVIYRSTATLRLWSSLQRVERRDLFMKLCTRLEDAVYVFFLNTTLVSFLFWVKTCETCNLLRLSTS